MSSQRRCWGSPDRPRAVGEPRVRSVTYSLTDGRLRDAACGRGGCASVHGHAQRSGGVRQPRTSSPANDADPCAGALHLGAKLAGSDRQGFAPWSARSRSHAADATWPSAGLAEAARDRRHTWGAEYRVGRPILRAERACHHPGLAQAEPDRRRLHQLPPGSPFRTGPVDHDGASLACAAASGDNLSGIWRDC